MPVDETTLNRFIKTARQRGAVSIDELRYAFSIEAMDADDVAAIVVRLEEAGIFVEIDPKLFSPKRDVSLNALSSPKTRTPQNTMSAGPTSRMPSAIQVSRSGEPVPKGSPSVGSGNKYPWPVLSPGKFLIWLTIFPIAIALLAVMWLSKF